MFSYHPAVYHPSGGCLAYLGLHLELREIWLNNLYFSELWHWKDLKRFHVVASFTIFYLLHHTVHLQTRLWFTIKVELGTFLIP